MKSSYIVPITGIQITTGLLVSANVIQSCTRTYSGLGIISNLDLALHVIFLVMFFLYRFGSTINKMSTSIDRFVLSSFAGSGLLQANDDGILKIIKTM